MLASRNAKHVQVGTSLFREYLRGFCGVTSSFLTRGASENLEARLINE